jgi:hypothetical protein
MVCFGLLLFWVSLNFILVVAAKALNQPTNHSPTNHRQSILTPINDPTVGTPKILNGISECKYASIYILYMNLRSELDNWPL